MEEDNEFKKYTNRKNEILMITILSFINDNAIHMIDKYFYIKFKNIEDANTFFDSALKIAYRTRFDGDINNPKAFIEININGYLNLTKFQNFKKVFINSPTNKNNCNILINFK